MVLISFTPAWGQTTAVPGVTVEARDVATNYVYTAQTNENGQYTLANLRDATYTLRARIADTKDRQVLTALRRRLRSPRPVEA